MTNIILCLIILAVLVGAGLYIYKAKKNGAGCIGCPHSKECGKYGCSCEESK